MHKVKKAIGVLRDYLGQDTRGINLLDDVSKIANELRNQAAVASENSCAVIRVGKDRQAEMASVQATVQKLSQELARKKSLLTQRERDVERLEAEKIKLQCELDSFNHREDITISSESPGTSNDALDNPRNFVSMVNNMKKNMRYAPAPARHRNPAPVFGDKIYEYEIGDILNNYSGSELIKLGSFVATLVMIGIPFFISRDLQYLMKGRTEKINDSVAKWFFPNNTKWGNTPEEEARYKAYITLGGAK